MTIFAVTALLFAPLLATGVSPLHKRWEPLISMFIFSPLLALLAIASRVYGIEPQLTLLRLHSLGWSESIAFKLDPLSALIGATVLIIVSVVQLYSLGQLREDANFERFLRNLAAVKTSLLFLIFSDHLILFMLGWWSVSYFLHLLLLHYSARPLAQKAAKQKFWVSRFGDLFMVLFALVTYGALGTLEFDRIAELLGQNSQAASSLQIQLAGALLVLGATTKSAQVPFHYWLPNTMETPSPVSALMHAGIINAGGFILVKLSPMVHIAELAQVMLVLIGGATAGYGTLKMWAQPRFKTSMAYSTISQMGFMMVQIGLTFYPLAVLHMIGHAFYKAYQFLNSGEALSQVQSQKQLYSMNSRPSFKLTALALTVVVSAVAMIGYIGLSSGLMVSASAMVLLLVLGLTTAQIFLNSASVKISIQVLVGIVVTYSLGGLALGWALESLPAETAAQHPFVLASYCLVSAVFLGLFLVQNNLPKLGQSSLGKHLYTQLMLTERYEVQS